VATRQGPVNQPGPVSLSKQEVAPPFSRFVRQGGDFDFQSMKSGFACPVPRPKRTWIVTFPLLIGFGPRCDLRRATAWPQKINFRPSCNCRADPKSPFGGRVLVISPNAMIRRQKAYSKRSTPPGKSLYPRECFLRIRARGDFGSELTDNRDLKPVIRDAYWRLLPLRRPV
jgi:hypothetical protein